MKTAARFVSAAALATLAGQAFAQPVLDGARDDAFYGTTPLWVQTQPTSFGDNSGAACDNTTIGSPGAVQTGIEVAIPLAAIGNPAPGSIKICIFINGQGHDFISNQVLPGIPSGTATQSSPNLGDPRTFDFSTVAGGVSGNQYFSGITTAGFGTPSVDGKLTAAAGESFVYGTLKATQTCRTGFGDATAGTPGICNGSEVDGVYAVVSGTNLYLLITGNLESNNNKLEIFLDTGAAGGQNQLRTNNPANMSRMCDDGTGNGLKFDAGFNANYWIGMGGADGGGGTYVGYVDFAQIGQTTGYYCGVVSAQSSGVLTGGDPGAPAILATIDNSNIAGVPGACPPPAGNANTANGSEIDSVYGKIYNGKLYLLVTGNCLSNYTKLNLFFDVGNGVGQNTLLLNNPPIDTGGGFADMCNNGTEPGLTFDTGFNACYWFSYGNGDVGAGTPPAVNQYVNALCLRTDGMRIDLNTSAQLDYGCYDGGDKATHQPITFSGPLLEPQTGLDAQLLSNYAPRASSAAVQANHLAPVPPATGLLKVAYDNSNTLGVTAASAAGAAAVTTGLEMEIDLAELACIENLPATCPGTSSITTIKVAGFLSSDSVTGSGGGYLQMSNQVLGGLPTSVAPGSTRSVNFANITGNQFVTITTGACYANCDGSSIAPILNANDFQCFLNSFAQLLPYANCDGSSIDPVLNANDFQCFLNQFAIGCP